MALKVLKNCTEGDKHGCNVSTVLCHGDRVVTGSDDGKIKLSRIRRAMKLWEWYRRKGKALKLVVDIWKPDLELVSEFEAPGGILSMAASDNMLYTCSTDQSIQSWDLNAMKNAGKVSTFLFQPQKLYVDKATKLLWAGDSQGNVAKFEEGEECGKFELVEEIWDLMVTSAPNLVYTARDRDVVVSELITNNGRPRVMIKGTFQGRSPFCIAGNNFCFMDRDGRNIIVHENNVDQKFPRLKEIVASELIINALTPATGDAVYSGGYDSTVKKWDLKSSNCLGSVNLGCCINALSCLSENEVYVAKSDGIVSKVGF